MSLTNIATQLEHLARGIHATRVQKKRLPSSLVKEVKKIGDLLEGLGPRLKKMREEANKTWDDMEQAREDGLNTFIKDNIESSPEYGDRDVALDDYSETDEYLELEAARNWSESIFNVLDDRDGMIRTFRQFGEDLQASASEVK